VERFLKERRERSDDVAIKASIRLAAAEMKESGTAFVGDISNTLASWEILAEAGMGGVVFHEIFCGSKDAAADASEMVAVATARIAALPPCEGLRASIAPHAPYTVPEALFREISAWAAKHDAPVSVHLAEDAAENEYFRDGRGAFREWFEREGFWPWPPGFRPMGCGSAETLAGWGFWNRRTLAVHGAALWPEDLSLLRESGAALCLCPRSNLYIGGKLPPLCEIFRSGVPLALGTDSLASNHDLNLLREMSHLAEACARLGIAEAAPRRILRMATAGGAAALGMERGRTEFSEGGFPAVMKVSFPSGEKDPEDFLVRRGWEFKIQRLV
jgi:cytosine/adenosine deaminase-related metal-dependent hydrolase